MVEVALWGGKKTSLNKRVLAVIQLRVYDLWKKWVSNQEDYQLPNLYREKI